MSEGGLVVFTCRYFESPGMEKHPIALTGGGNQGNCLEGEASVSADATLAIESIRQRWEREQVELKDRLITGDQFTWRLPPLPGIWNGSVLQYDAGPCFGVDQQSISTTARKQAADTSPPCSASVSGLTAFPSGPRDAGNGDSTSPGLLGNESTVPGKRGITAATFLGESDNNLRLVGGVDVSFSADDANRACAALVVVELRTLRVVYEAYEDVQMTQPYIAGFLAFRECPVLVRLLQRVAREQPSFMPQVVLVDGNGLLHPRGFGLACHLGVLADIPTIGVSKNMIHMDGMTAEGVRELITRHGVEPGGALPLRGSSGRVWGVAILSKKDVIRPIFVSTGHRVSLETAVAVVQRCCFFRVPEPVRQADLRSREYLRRNSSQL